MYVIRFSKINRSSIERPYNMRHNYLFVNFLPKKNSGTNDRTDTTPTYQPQLAAPFNSPCLSMAMRSK